MGDVDTDTSPNGTRELSIQYNKRSLVTKDLSCSSKHRIRQSQIKEMNNKSISS